MVGITVMVMMVITMMVNYSNANDGVDYFRGNNHNGDVIMMVVLIMMVMMTLMVVIVKKVMVHE
jgi:hypothetical protein